MQPATVSVEIVDPHRQRAQHEQGDGGMWCPHDLIHSRVVVSSSTSFCVENVFASLLGFARVWALTGELKHEWTAYKFLHQSLKIVTPNPATDADAKRNEYIANLNLTIPSNVMNRTGRGREQCLKLPPTISVGEELRGYGNGLYAQPRIDYRLHIKIDAVFGDGSSRRLTGEKEIAVMPCSDAPPPVDIGDFGDDFIASASNASRTSLLGEQYMMTLSIAEPPSMSKARAGGAYSTVLRLAVDIHAARHKRPTKDANNKLLDRLKRLSFTLEPTVRAKTFYSLQPFPMMPAQNMVDNQGPIRLHDSITKVSKVELSTSSWHARFFDDVPCYEDAVGSGSFASGFSCMEFDRASVTQYGSPLSTTLSNGPSALGAWKTSIDIPVELTGSLHPSFCSAVASRQYSIVVRVRVNGLSVKDFILEVPLQVHYKMCVAATYAMMEDESSRDMSGDDMDDDLPVYH
ncbi:uncharacterized protein LTR77_011254 [Saxophila tyrrhenica]|uniref:Arrestin C-terminal-like domain-containing protein n=1 Tax=Saxophila tyrrhenica TaxID=1690608 RepID=A0AAV9NTC8_9PEZI|nr:hypothetical protein LTR77_011254 [Saxophila tyrrhenica]